MSGAATREISPYLVRFRNFLIGRDSKNPLRFQHQVTERPGPEANLPEGPAHKVFGNYYFTRDARREVMRPKVLADSTSPLALPMGDAAGDASALAAKAGPKLKTPGRVFHYDSANP